MFSFRAYFWKNNVYIDEKNKYAANEILTAYLDTDYVSSAEDYIRELKSLCKKLLLSPDMDYSYYEQYNKTVRTASSLFRRINDWILKLPPYDKLFLHEPRTLEDVLNETSFVFDDGIGDHDAVRITWDTVTETGYGEQRDNGMFHIRLTKFFPDEPENISLYDPDMKEALLGLNDSIMKFFEDYITYLKSYIAVHRVFKPFIDTYLHSGNCFPQENDVAKLYERFAAEHRRSFDHIKCTMQSFGYKVLNDQQNQPILCEKILFADLQSFLFYDFFNGIKRNYIPNKCKQCGKYFLIRAGKYYSYCDRPLDDASDKTCRDTGARKRYNEKCKTDPVWQTYNRAYKAHYARYMKKKMTVSEFEQWSRFASELRDQALADQIPYEQYYADIRK